jgi:phage tail P2-like protein
MSDTPLMTLANVDMAALLPASVGSDPDVIALCAALDGEWQAIAAALPTLGVLATISQQPADVLDRLAWQFHVDYWDATWDVATKRQTIIDSIRLHMIAGTRGAVDDVIDHIWGGGAFVLEWWEYGGEPGTFQVVLTTQQTQDAVEDFIRSIRKVKRATDHLTIVQVDDYGDVPVRAGAAYHEWKNFEVST